jgi:putative Holliday junction resolvase
MAIRNPAELKQILTKGQRILGLDIGTKTIGLALSDPLLMVATPMETIRRGRFRDDAARIAYHVRTLDVGALVVGLPVTMEGSEGPRCQSVRQIARNLEAVVGIPIVFWDERFSTAAVEREMIAADLTRKRRAAIVDRVAAAYILQGLLDYLSRQPDPG